MQHMQTAKLRHESTAVVTERTLLSIIDADGLYSNTSCAV